VKILHLPAEKQVSICDLWERNVMKRQRKAAFCVLLWQTKEHHYKIPVKSGREERR